MGWWIVGSESVLIWNVAVNLHKASIERCMMFMYDSVFCKIWHVLHQFLLREFFLMNKYFISTEVWCSHISISNVYSIKVTIWEPLWNYYHIHLHGVVILLIFLQNNVTPNSTPLQPLNGDSPGILSSAADGISSNPGSRKRPSDSTVENLRKKIKKGEENSEQVWNIIYGDVGI